MHRYIDAEKLKSILRPMEWGTPDERWVPEHEIANVLDFFPAADVVERSKVRKVLLEEFGRDEEEAIDALMEKIDG